MQDLIADSFGLDRGHSRRMHPADDEITAGWGQLVNDNCHKLLVESDQKIHCCRGS